MKTIGILTSGGDSPGMNAAVRAVVRTALAEDMKIYGVQHGYEGLIDGNMEEMVVSSVSDILHRGGTILKTARSERFLKDEWRRKARDMAVTFGIEGLVLRRTRTHKAGPPCDVPSGNDRQRLGVHGLHNRL